MPQIEFNVRYKINIDDMDVHDSEVLTMQYSFVPDSFRDSDIRMTTSGETAVVSVSRSNIAQEARPVPAATAGTDVVLKGSLQCAPNDSILIFDPNRSEFRLLNSGVAIQGLKRDRQDEFRGTDGKVLTMADVSKRLKHVSRNKKRVVPPVPSGTESNSSVCSSSDRVSDTVGESVASVTGEGAGG